LILAKLGPEKKGLDRAGGGFVEDHPGKLDIDGRGVVVFQAAKTRLEGGVQDMSDNLCASAPPFRIGLRWRGEK
jgi:hypothetical protein